MYNVATRKCWQKSETNWITPVLSGLRFGNKSFNQFGHIVRVKFCPEYLHWQTCICDRTYYDPPLIVDHGHLLFKTLNNEKFRVETEFSINDHQKFDHVSLVAISALLVFFNKVVNCNPKY